MNPEAMILNTAGINAVSKALNAANSAAASNKSGPKYKKAPDAPKRFKSAFIIYSAEKHREIKEELISQGRTEKVRWMMNDDYCIDLIRCFTGLVIPAAGVIPIHTPTQLVSSFVRVFVVAHFRVDHGYRQARIRGVA